MVNGSYGFIRLFIHYCSGLYHCTVYSKRRETRVRVETKAGFKAVKPGVLLPRTGVRLYDVHQHLGAPHIIHKQQYHTLLSNETQAPLVFK
jgi:hypothetical protein